jgi:hypothetical protein
MAANTNKSVKMSSKGPAKRVHRSLSNVYQRLLLCCCALLETSRVMDSQANALSSESGMFSPVAGGQMLRFSGVSAAIAASWTGQVSHNSLLVSCIFTGSAFEDSKPRRVPAALYGADGLSCMTPAATLPSTARIQIMANSTTLTSSLTSMDVYYYGLLSFSPAVGMADGSTEIELHIVGYPREVSVQYIKPACRFDAGGSSLTLKNRRVIVTH